MERELIFSGDPLQTTRNSLRPSCRVITDIRCRLEENWNCCRIPTSLWSWNRQGCVKDIVGFIDENYLTVSEAGDLTTVGTRLSYLDASSISGSSICQLLNSNIWNCSDCLIFDHIENPAILYLYIQRIAQEFPVDKCEGLTRSHSQRQMRGRPKFIDVVTRLCKLAILNREHSPHVQPIFSQCASLIKYKVDSFSDWSKKMPN